MMQRSGEVVITMLPNVQQNTIAPLIKRTIAKGTVVYTDEYDIYGRLTEWGYPHHTVCHSAGEFARDEDGDGFCEIHVNTIEGFWSLLRSWLRPHRGVSQEKLPLYLGLFEFVQNVRKRGKALLGALIELLVTPTPRNILISGLTRFRATSRGGIRNVVSPPRLHVPSDGTRKRRCSYKTSHRLRRRSLADPAGILAECPVAHAVQAVLDPPVAAGQPQQAALAPTRSCGKLAIPSTTSVSTFSPVRRSRVRR